MKKQNLTPYNNKGQRHGYWEIYHNNVIIFSKGNYINGRRNGLWEFYYDNGYIWYKCDYINDKIYGYWKIFNQDGDLIRKEYRII